MQNCIKPYRLGRALLCLAMLGNTASAQANETLVLVRSGDLVNDSNGTYAQFAPPIINSQNALVFSAKLTNTQSETQDDSGIYRINIPQGSGTGIVTTIGQLAREGSAFTAGSEDFVPADLYINSAFLIKNSPFVTSQSAGQFNNVALMLPLQSGSGEYGNSIIAVENSETFTLVAQAGAPVASGNGEYREFTRSALLGIGDNNQLSFFSALNGTDNQDLDNTALFKRYNDDTIVELVRKGDDFVFFGGIYSNDIGSHVFQGTTGATEDENSVGLYVSAANSNGYVLIVHEGDEAPVNDADVRIISSLHEARINNHEQVAFIASLVDADGFAVEDSSALFINDSQVTQALLVKGQSTPDGSARYSDFLGGFSGIIPRPALNSAGQVVFRIKLLDDEGQSQGVYKTSTTETVEIAKQDTVYQDGVLRNFSDPAINNAGLVVFEADLVLGEEMGNEGPFMIMEEVLIISDGTHYETVARTGEEYFGRTLIDFSFDNTTYGQSNGFSDSGVVAYKATYEDGSQAIHVWLPQFGWRGTSSEGNWDDIQNWMFGGFPNATSDLILNGDQDAIIHGPSQDTMLNSLTIGGGSGQVELRLSAIQLTLNEPMLIEQNAILQGFGVIDGAVNNLGQVSVQTSETLEITGEFSNQGQISGDASSQINFLSSFDGSERINVSGLTSFAGEVLLGDSPALLEIDGNVEFQENATLNLRIEGKTRGTSYDALAAAGQLDIAGNLTITLANGVILQAGDRFELITAGTINGSFTQLNLPTLNDTNIQLSLENSNNALVLVVSAIETQTPEETIEESSGGGSLNIYMLLYFMLILASRSGLHMLRRNI